MKKLSNERFNNIFNNFSGKKIAVIGDVMLDRYFWGSVSRVSPEAPVPVIDLEKETYHLGGAANVANNLNSMGVQTLLCGVIGNDENGKRFKEIAHDLGIDPKGLYQDKERTTTVKTRIIGNNQHIARLDEETRRVIDSKGREYILETIRSNKDIVSVVFGDYDKGAISKELIDSIIKYAKENNIECVRRS